MDWTRTGKVVYLVHEYNGKFYHVPWFPVSSYRPHWVEEMIQHKLHDGYTVLIYDFGFHYAIPEFYNDIPKGGEQLSLEL